MFGLAALFLQFSVSMSGTHSMISAQRSKGGSDLASHARPAQGARVKWSVPTAL